MRCNHTVDSTPGSVQLGSGLLVHVPVLLFRVQSTVSRPGTVDLEDKTEAVEAANPRVFSVVCIHCMQFQRLVSCQVCDCSTCVLYVGRQVSITMLQNCCIKPAGVLQVLAVVLNMTLLKCCCP